MGMMRFANYDSPILLEVLGDLLFNTGNRSAARHLASRAYLKASYEVTDPKNKEVYRKRAAYVLHTQYANKAKKFLDLKQLKILLDKDIKRGELFYQELKKDELLWISEGKEVEEAFLKKYYNAPRLPRLSFAGISRKKVTGMQKYLRENYPIRAQVDYRPILAHKVNLDIKEQTFIDSLFERRLELELVIEAKKKNIKQDENTIELSNTDTSWGGIGIVFILVILGAVFFFFKK